MSHMRQRISYRPSTAPILTSPHFPHKKELTHSLLYPLINKCILLSNFKRLRCVVLLRVIISIDIGQKYTVNKMPLHIIY